MGRSFLEYYEPQWLILLKATTKKKLEKVNSNVSITESMLGLQNSHKHCCCKFHVGAIVLL